MTYAEFLPVAGLAVIAWFLSHVLYGRFTPSIRAVLLTLVIASAVMTLIGTAMFLLLYRIQTESFAFLALDGGVNWVIYFLKLGGLTAFFWLPVLLIVALGQARRVPKLS